MRGNERKGKEEKEGEGPQSPLLIPNTLRAAIEREEGETKIGRESAAKQGEGFNDV